MSKPMSLCLRSILSLATVLFANLAFAQSREPVIRPRAPQQQQQQQQPAVMPAQPQPPKAPFQLTPQQEQQMDKLLAAWERESDTVKLFRCKFTRWDYDQTFGPKKNDFLMSERTGEILFRAPDCGTFKEKEMKLYDADKDKYFPSTEALDHWQCDGTAIYQFKPQEKILEVTQLPPDMRGKAITDGPLPFVFGAKAKTLKERYWFKETTPPEQKGKEVWLEAWPKFREQAANFSHVEIILGAKDLMPVAMQVYLPNKLDHTAYLFEDRKVNDKFGDFVRGDFLPPMTPPFWTKKVVNLPGPPAAQVAPKNPPKQAARPNSGSVRK